MILETELKLVSEIVGCRVVKGQPRQFIKTPDNKIAIIREVWLDNMIMAAGDLELPFKPVHVTLPEGYTAPKLQLLRRTYNRTSVEDFESIPKGTIIKLDFMIREQKFPPENFAKILQLVGTNYGISQWGNHFGYGRFDIQFIRRKTLNINLNFELDVSPSNS